MKIEEIVDINQNIKENISLKPPKQEKDNKEFLSKLITDNSIKKETKSKKKKKAEKESRIKRAEKAEKSVSLKQDAAGPEKEDREKKQEKRIIEVRKDSVVPSANTKEKRDKKWFEPTRQSFSMKNLGEQEGELTIDVYQTDKDIVIQSVIAGITPKDIDISIENDMVVIKGNRKKPFEKEKRNYYFQECYWGRFSREIVLPEEVDNSRAQASLKNGILTIRIPKIERNKKRKIAIE